MTEQENGVVSADQSLVRVPELHEVFSEWTIRGIPSWEEAAHLGRNNIGYLLARARASEKELSARIGTLKERQKLFQGRDGSHFVELAGQFDNPDITQKGAHPSGGWSQEPEPLGIQYEQRAHGSTNYNICGWCEHASGSHRFSYCISGGCQLLSEMREGADRVYGEDVEGEAPYYHHEVKFDTPCQLHALTSEQCQGIVNGIVFKVGVTLAKRELVRAAIRKLIQLRDAADGDRPWLVGFRPHDYMNVGDELVVYIGGWADTDKASKTVDGNWADAIGIFGYRHHDGCMSYQTLFPIHSNLSFYEGRGGEAGMGRPEVLLRSEFEYLHKVVGQKDLLDQLLRYEADGTSSSDVIFARCWFRNIDRDLTGFDPDLYYHALKHPRFVQPPEGWQSPTDEIEVRTV